MYKFGKFFYCVLKCFLNFVYQSYIIGIILNEKKNYSLFQIGIDNLLFFGLGWGGFFCQLSCMNENKFKNNIYCICILYLKVVDQFVDYNFYFYYF